MTTPRGVLRVHAIESATRLGVDAFVTDRFGGVSEPPYDELNLGDHVGDNARHVAENRRRVAQAIAVPIERFITVRQVHANSAAEVTGPLDVEADAMVSSTPGIALAILVADCVPVLLIDESTPRFAVVHAGWRGLHTRILEASLAHFARPSAVHAFVGPCISLERYQVGPEVAEHFTGVPDAVVPDAGDRFRLDLQRVTVHQLTSLGVSADHITTSSLVTDGGTTFFSDRAARPCGRFALVARLAS